MGHYYDTILYSSKNDVPPGTSHGKETMAFSPRDIETWIIHLRRKAKFSNGGGYNVWLVPEKLNFLRYASCPRSVPGELVHGPLDVSTSRTSSVLFEEKTMTRGTSRGMR